MKNAQLTQYPAWRIWPVHIVAKLFGVLVKVDAMPYGSLRIWRKNNRHCSGPDQTPSQSLDSSVLGVIGSEPSEDDMAHASDCAIYNEPAMPGGSCDCGALLKAERRSVSCLCLLAGNRVARLRTSFRSWLGQLFLKRS